jgi:hypothetical protein
MVKVRVEQGRLRAPGSFEYTSRYSLQVLVTALVVAWLPLLIRPGAYRGPDRIATTAAR